MAGFTTSVQISRSPEDVFDFVTEPDTAPTVVDSVTSMVKLTDGPIGVGTRFRETRVMRGKEESAELEIVAYQRAQNYSVKNVTAGIETVYHYTFRPERGGTGVDLVCEVTARGVRKLMTPIVAAVLKKEDREHLAHLKNVLEAPRDE